MKIQDPTVAFSKVVTRRRRSRARANGEQFRLGLHGLDCSGSSHVTGRSTVIGASAWALKSEQVDHTVEIIGLVGGLLADLGFQVCPIGASTDRIPPPSLVVWVCGDETQADEYDQLAEIGAPGVSIGSCVDGLDDWGFLASDELEDRDHFIRRFVEEVGAILGEQAGAPREHF